MIRNLTKNYFGIIKNAKFKQQKPLTIQRILECRKLFNMQIPKAQSDLNKLTQDYIKQRCLISKALNQDNLLENWQENNLLKTEIDMLALRTQMDGTQYLYVQNVLKFWGTFFLRRMHNYSNNKSKTSEIFLKAIKDFYISFSQLLYLIDLDQSMVSLYLKFYSLNQKLKLVQDKSTSEIKYVFDTMLTFKKISIYNIQNYLGFVSKYNPHHYYFQRQYDIWNLIYTSLPREYQRISQNQKLINFLLKSVIKNSLVSSSLITFVKQIFSRHSNINMKLMAFRALIQIFEINKENINSNQYKRVISSFIQKIGQNAFKILSQLFYKADIWLLDFWKPYFAFMMQKNHFQDYQFNIQFHIIDALTTSGRGGQQIKILGLQFRQKMLKQHNINLPDLDCRRQQQKLYGAKIENKTSLQLHVANSMRLNSRIQVLTEVQLRYFSVDVLIGGSLVVEINNYAHYKLINGVERLNLKSAFRQRMIRQWGYQYKNLKVDDYGNGSYNILEEVNKIVQDTLIFNKKKQSKI